jgi:hypothetical protein
MEQQTVRRRRIPLNLTPKEREEELDDLAEKTAKAVLQASENGELDEEEEIDSQDEFETKLAQESQKTNDTNPFTLAEGLQKAGIAYEYKVTKNGAHMGLIHDELNEDILAQKFGGGNFTVGLFKLNPKKFIKQMSFRIADPVKQEVPKDEGKQDVTAILLKSIDERAKQLEQTFREKEARLEADRNRERQEYKDRLEQEREERKLELLERNSDKNKGGSILETIAALKTIIPEPKDNTTEIYKLMMEMQKGTNEMIKAIGDSNREMIKEMNDKTEKMFDKIANKKEGLTDMQIQEKIDNARREAKEDFRERQIEIKEAAEERALILAGKEPAEEKEESVIDGILKQLPALIMASKRASAPAVPAPVQRLAAPVRPQQRQIAPVKRPMQVTPAQMGVKPRPVQKTVHVSLNNNLNHSSESLNQMPNNNLNKMPTPVTIDKDKEKEEVGMTLSGILMDGIAEKKASRQVGMDCFNALSNQKLFSKRVFEYYPLSDLKQLRDAFSPDVSDSWIEDFYAVLQEKSGYNGQYDESAFGGVN